MKFGELLKTIRPSNRVSIYVAHNPRESVRESEWTGNAGFIPPTLAKALSNNNVREIAISAGVNRTLYEAANIGEPLELVIGLNIVISHEQEADHGNK